MRTIYVDNKTFQCYIEGKTGRTAIETSAFDGMCDEYILGYRFVPAGKVWTAPNGVKFAGPMLSPVEDYDKLSSAQRKNELTGMDPAGLIGVDPPDVLAGALRYTLDKIAETIADTDAYDFYEIYDVWREDTEYKAGYKVRYADQECIFKCRQDHVSQLGWNPLDAPTLWETLNESHKGTKDDPIPAGLNMIYYKGLYYIEEQGLYLCTRDSVIALQHMPHDLVGHYFEKVETR